jgi:hypothetical protein
MIRAYIHDNYFGPSIAVSIVRDYGNEDDRGLRPPAHILRFESCGEGEDLGLIETWRELDPQSASSEPTLRLGHQEAIALMTGLARHFQGVDDQRMLRQDYQAERKRVDELVGILGDVARRRFGG